MTSTDNVTPHKADPFSLLRDNAVKIYADALRIHGEISNDPEKERQMPIGFYMEHSTALAYNHIIDTVLKEFRPASSAAKYYACSVEKPQGTGISVYTGPAGDPDRPALPSIEQFAEAVQKLDIESLRGTYSIDYIGNMLALHDRVSARVDALKQEIARAESRDPLLHPFISSQTPATWQKRTAVNAGTTLGGPE